MRCKWLNGQLRGWQEWDTSPTVALSSVLFWHVWSSPKRLSLVKVLTWLSLARSLWVELREEWRGIYGCVLEVELWQFEKDMEGMEGLIHGLGTYRLYETNAVTVICNQINNGIQCYNTISTKAIYKLASLERFCSLQPRWIYTVPKESLIVAKWCIDQFAMYIPQIL
jgi:hypothetical protein